MISNRPPEGIYVELGLSDMKKLLPTDWLWGLHDVPTEAGSSKALELDKLEKLLYGFDRKSRPSINDYPPVLGFRSGLWTYLIKGHHRTAVSIHKLSKGETGKLRSLIIRDQEDLDYIKSLIDDVNKAYTRLGAPQNSRISKLKDYTDFPEPYSDFNIVSTTLDLWQTGMERFSYIEERLHYIIMENMQPGLASAYGLKMPVTMEHYAIETGKLYLDMFKTDKNNNYQ